jgi:hypothetical protein
LKLQARLLLVVSVALSTTVFFSGCRTPVPLSKPPSNTQTVRLDIDGDPKLVHKFALLMEAELVGTNVRLTDHDPADAVLKGELRYETSSNDYGILAIHQQLSWDGDTRSVGLCDEAFGGFDEANRRPAPNDLSNEENIAAQVRRTFPKAQFIHIDPSSSYRASSEFPAALHTALVHQNLLPSDPLPDAVSDLITVRVVKATVTGRTIHYRLAITGTGSEFNEEGNGELEDRSPMVYPSYCQNKVNPFTISSDSLAGLAFRAAQSFAKSSSPSFTN